MTEHEFMDELREEKPELTRNDIMISLLVMLLGVLMFVGFIVIYDGWRSQF